MGWYMASVIRKLQTIFAISVFLFISELNHITKAQNMSKIQCMHLVIS